MQDFRAFEIGADGHVRTSHEIWCKDEAEAKERARSLVDGYDVELWRRDKMIARFSHAD